MFKGNDNGTGFHITFENGWTASVQWGHATYSDNKNRREHLKVIDSTTAEIAAWDKDGNWYDFGEDKVQGWQSPAEVNRFLTMVAGF